MNKKQVISFLIFLLVTLWSEFVRSEDVIKKDIRSDESVKEDSVVQIKSPRGAMIRSLLIPGWGQFYNGKWFKAIIVIGAEMGLVANAIYLDYQLDQSTDLLAQNFYRDNRNLSFWWLGATILLSMLDAYVDAHLYEFDESSDLSINFQTVKDTMNGMKLVSITACFSYSF